MTHDGATSEMKVPVIIEEGGFIATHPEVKDLYEMSGVIQGESVTLKQTFIGQEGVEINYDGEFISPTSVESGAYQSTASAYGESGNFSLNIESRQ